MPATTSDWTRLFPDEDYQFHFGVRTGPPEDFFRPTDAHAGLLEERVAWLGAAPHRYSALLPAGSPLLAETIELAHAWRSLPATAETIAETATCRELGEVWEPDFVLLRPNATGRFELVGGCVCFPSSWSLSEKLGRPLTEIHAPVPGLNRSLGDAIDRFLSRLKPGAAALRSNWGLSRTDKLNHHPDRRLPALAPPRTADEVFIRIENQALVALPKSGGLLFGIRLEIIPLTELLRFPAAITGLRRALLTMPAEVAAYKNLTAARAAIIGLLG